MDKRRPREIPKEVFNFNSIIVEEMSVSIFLKQAGHWESKWPQREMNELEVDNRSAVFAKYCLDPFSASAPSRLFFLCNFKHYQECILVQPFNSCDNQLYS